MVGLLLGDFVGRASFFFLLVERRFFCFCLRCPLTVAPERGGNLRSRASVSPGTLWIHCRISAFSSADKVGEKKEPCMKATMSAGVAALIAERASWFGGYAPCMYATMSSGVAMERADKATCPGGKACIKSGVKMGLGVPAVVGSAVGIVEGAGSADGVGHVVGAAVGAGLSMGAVVGVGTAMGLLLAVIAWCWRPDGLMGTSMIHKRVNGVRVPRRMILFFNLTVTSPAEKRTAHPASQNCPMESNGLDANSGTMCPVFAAVGRSGKYISAVCVDAIVAPLGFVIWIGVVATWMFDTGVSSGKKREVQPVSPMEAKVALLLLCLCGGPMSKLKDKF